MDSQNNLMGIDSEIPYESQEVSLGRRIRRGGVWVFSGRIIRRVLGLLRTIILARLLSPNDFGLFGIALLTMSILDTFSQTGFRQALIQKKGDTRSYLDTAWTIGIIRAIAIAAIIFCAAPLVAAFFNTPPAGAVLRVIGLAIIVQSLCNITVVCFEKELEFHKYFAYQIAGTVVDLGVSVTAALIFCSVWAIIAGCLAGNIAMCVASYVIDPYRPRLRLDVAKAKELFGFGKWILGSSVLIFLLTQGDDIFVGKLLGATMLGFYQMAYRISNLPATEYSHLIATVMFPAYSKFRDNMPKLRKAYLGVLQLTSYLSVPIAGLIFVLSPDFTRIFLGEKWTPMVPAMMVLALYGMLRAIGATTGVVFMAVGRPKIRTKIATGQLILLAVLIYPLTARWGITGTSVAVTAYALIFNFVAVHRVLTIIGSGPREALKAIVLPAAATLLMVMTMCAIKKFALSAVGPATFVLLAAAGMGVYAAITLLFDVLFGYGSMRLMREQIVAYRNRGGGR